MDAVRSGRFWILPNADVFASTITGVAESALSGDDPPLADLLL
jgi:hypothetical protein